MSAKLPLQSKAARPRFERKVAVFGDDDDVEEKVADELVFGVEDNQVKEVEPKPAIVPKSIAPLSNSDWRLAAKRKRELFIPAKGQPQVSADETKPEVLEQTADSFGLQIQQRKETEVITETVVTEQQIEIVQEQVKKSLEESAIEAIIKESKGEIEEKDSGPAKVIPANEALVFKDDVENRPDETTMEDYENMPVDEFGAALLRGFGWNEGEGIGRNRKNIRAPPPTPVKQREALLGLGATPEDVDKDAKSKYNNKREAYQYKDTSLFKKISKKKYDKYDDKYSSSRDSSSSRRRYDDDYDDRHSSRHSSRSSSSTKRRYDDDDRYSGSSKKGYGDDQYRNKSSSSSSSKRKYDDDDRYRKSSSSSRKKRYEDNDKYREDDYKERKSGRSTKA